MEIHGRQYLGVVDKVDGRVGAVVYVRGGSGVGVGPDKWGERGVDRGGFCVGGGAGSGGGCCGSGDGG